MMEYNEFKDRVMDEIKNYLPPVFKDFQVQVKRISKTNEEKDVMNLIPKEYEGGMALPNIYLDDMYEIYREEDVFEGVMKAMAGVIVTYTGAPVPFEVLLEEDELKEYVVPVLVNREKNRNLLEAAPHYDLLDLSVIYRVIVTDDDAEEITSAVVDESVASGIGLTKDKIRQVAEANLARLYPPEYVDLGGSMGVISNNLRYFGAIGMTDVRVLEEASQKLGGDLCLIPTSVHEVMAVAAEDASIKTVQGILELGNSTVIEENEFLSGNVYFYDSKEKKLSIAKG